MPNVIYLARHGLASAEGRKNASIGTSPPDISLKRLARPREASFRPAKMLRRCAPEQSAASASAAMDFALASAQRSIGCFDMGQDISPRNDKSQHEIFPPEMELNFNDLVKSGMGKRSTPPPREIYLGDWLDLFDIGPSEAARIAGCSQSYISNISRGARDNVNVLYLLKLSEHMDVNINDFFRPLPSRAQLAPLKKLSPKARSAILDRQQKKA